MKNFKFILFTAAILLLTGSVTKSQNLTSAGTFDLSFSVFTPNFYMSYNSIPLYPPVYHKAYRTVKIAYPERVRVYHPVKIKKYYYPEIRKYYYDVKHKKQFEKYYRKAERRYEKKIEKSYKQQMKLRDNDKSLKHQGKIVLSRDKSYKK